MSSISCGFVILERVYKYEKQDKYIFALNPSLKKGTAVPNFPV